LYTRFISSPAWGLIAHHRSSDSKLPASAEARAPNSRKVPRAGVERVFILPEKVPRRISEFRFDFVVNSRCRHSGTNEVVPFPFRTENVGKTGRFLSCGSRRSREGGDCGIPPCAKGRARMGHPASFQKPCENSSDQRPAAAGIAFLPDSRASTCSSFSIEEKR
jgi:hypothetical protein